MRIHTFIAIVVPMIVAFIKTKLWDNIPAWLIPILAAVLGPAIDQGLAHLGTAYQGTGWLAALIGAAGVGVREIYDQLFGKRPAA